MSKITPGPWEIGKPMGQMHHPIIAKGEKGNLIICSVFETLTDGEDEANAVAVAAVPDLVDAVVFVLGLLNTLTTEEFSRGGDKWIRERLEAALRKAGLEI